MHTSIRQVVSKKPVHVKLKNTESKYLTPTDKEDPVLPALFVFQGMRGSGKSYACVQMCRHFEKKGYIQRTFLLCPTAGEKNQKETICTNLKTLDQKDVCTDINNFEKALVQKFLLHKSIHQLHSSQKIIERGNSCSRRARLQSSFHGSQTETTHAYILELLL